MRGRGTNRREWAGTVPWFSQSFVSVDDVMVCHKTVRDVYANLCFLLMSWATHVLFSEVELGCSYVMC